MAHIHRKTGDTRMFETVCLAADQPVDLTDATVEFRMSPTKPGQGPTVAAAGQVLQAGAVGGITNQGLVGYAPTAGDVAVAGVYRVEWHVALPDGQRPVFPSDGYDSLVLEPAL